MVRLSYTLRGAHSASRMGLTPLPLNLALVAELADAPDSKSGSSECGFESHRAHATPYQVCAHLACERLGEVDNLNGHH